MRPTIVAVAILVAGIAGCGGDDQPQRPQAGGRTATGTGPTNAGPGVASETNASEQAKSTNRRNAALARRPAGAEGLRVPAKRARIVARKSDYGRVLFDANGQVVYVFEDDRRNRSNCRSAECVQAWPPVLTRQRPSAGAEGA